MPLLDLNEITAGPSKTWAGFLRDRDRSHGPGTCTARKYDSGCDLG
jgi:hypothetical protein